MKTKTGLKDKKKKDIRVGHVLNIKTHNKIGGKKNCTKCTPPLLNNPPTKMSEEFKKMLTTPAKAEFLIANGNEISYECASCAKDTFFDIILDNSATRFTNSGIASSGLTIITVI